MKTMSVSSLVCPRVCVHLAEPDGEVVTAMLHIETPFFHPLPMFHIGTLCGRMQISTYLESWYLFAFQPLFFESACLFQVIEDIITLMRILLGK